MMQFKHLITHHLWTRSYSHLELAKLLACSEQEVMDFEDGVLPTPSQAYCIQKTLSYPKIQFWEIYFRSVCLHHGMDMELMVIDREEQLQYLMTSINYRKTLNHGSIPSTECWLGIEMDKRGPLIGEQDEIMLNQSLNTVLTTQLQLDDTIQDYNPEDIQNLADKYEVSSKSMSRLIKDRAMPNEDELQRLISRSQPGYERERMMKGYFSSIIQVFHLNIVTEEKVTQALINQLDKQGKDKVFKKRHKG